MGKGLEAQSAWSSGVRAVGKGEGGRDGQKRGVHWWPLVLCIPLTTGQVCPQDLTLDRVSHKRTGPLEVQS